MRDDMNDLLAICVDVARQAGAAIMDLYDEHDLTLAHKADDSPLTRADLAANTIIETTLTRTADFPIISEEGAHDAGKSPTFWLVDPLDGTKEFLKHNGEFTVNIALVFEGVPRLGVVYAPALDTLYWGAEGLGAYIQIGNDEPVAIRSSYEGQQPTVVVSRSHADQETADFLDKLGPHHALSMGSSLKLCLVAEGVASVYPRFGPTSLWDTAAADAVVRTAGGSVTDMSEAALRYEPQKTLLNPAFIVRAGSY